MHESPWTERCELNYFSIYIPPYLMADFNTFVCVENLICYRIEKYSMIYRMRPGPFWFYNTKSYFKLFTVCLIMSLYE